MHRFACYNSKFFSGGYAPEHPYWGGAIALLPKPYPLRHSGAARLPLLARASIVPQCLLAVDATGTHNDLNDTIFDTMVISDLRHG